MPPASSATRSPFLGASARLGFMEDEVMAGLRILIADPYSQLREIIRDILLRGIGVQEVVEAKNGEEALSMLKEMGCDVAILDAAMAPMGGIEITKKVRAGIEGIDPFTPIIIMSGNPEISEIIQARDVGANEYLAKPLSAKLLDLRLNAVIKRPRPFVRSDNFFGPDRRRHDEGGFKGDDRRNIDPEIVPQ